MYATSFEHRYKCGINVIIYSDYWCQLNCYNRKHRVVCIDVAYMNYINCIYAGIRYVVSEFVYVLKQSSVHLVVNKL